MYIVVTIVVSFLLNFLWENLHAPLYSHHLGQKIETWTLFVATLGDVIILSLFVLLWKYFPFLKDKLFLVIPLGLLIAYYIEKYALSVNRWSYNDSMPIVPVLSVGISPLLQLATTGFLLLLLLKKLELLS